MLDIAELRQEHTRLESAGQDNFLNNFVRMPEGDGVVVVRLLPPKKGAKLYCATRTHKLGTKNLHCPQTLTNGRWGGFCPICNYYRSLWRDADQAGGEQAGKLQAEARGIKPLERFYYNVVVRTWTNPQTGVQEKDVGPKILSIGKNLHARIIRAILGDAALEEPELGDVTDPKNGRDLRIIKRIRKSGQDSFPNYEESKFANESVLGTDKQISGWMEALHDLQALRQLKSPEELSKELRIFRGLEQDPSLSFDFGNNADKREATPMVMEKPRSNVLSDVDEATVEDDFLSSLKNM